jgi:Rieske Fe-S protein
LAELQRDPVTRGQFLTMGIVGSLVGAVLTIPPFVYMINPVIKTNFLGESDVPDDWIEVGSVWEIPSGSPKVYRVEFPQEQTYDAGQPGVVEERDNVGSITNAVLVTWRDGKLPGVLEDDRGTRTLSASEVEELTRRINVLSNHCAHLGCPVRWHADKGLIVCPCHGGEYDINGGYRAGPPPHGLFRFAYEIREDGGLYVKHDFTNGTPWVV